MSLITDDDISPCTTVHHRPHFTTQRPTISD